MKVEIDSEARILTVGGIKYAYEFLVGLACGPVGTVFEVLRRSDGAVTLRTVSSPVAEKAKVEGASV